MSESNNQLQSILDDILDDKNTNLTPDNLKKGVTCLGIKGRYNGIDTSDATVTTNDILQGKTAYKDGQKITGTMPNVGNKEIVSNINSEKSITINGYVGKITSPSIKSIIDTNSKTEFMSAKCVGDNNTKTLTATIETKIGCRVYAIVVAQHPITVSKTWELFQSIVTSPSNGEMWYQTMYVYTKIADGVSESFSVSQEESSPLYITMTSFDSSESTFVKWSKSNVVSKESSFYIEGGVSPNDYVLVTQIQDKVTEDEEKNQTISTNSVTLEGVENTRYITVNSTLPKLTLFKIGGAKSSSAMVKFGVPTEYAIMVLRFNTALRAENIRANIKIMDIVGTLSENQISKIKYFTSINEMKVSTDNKDGDYAAVIDDNNEFIGVYKYENEQWKKQTVDTDDATAATTDIVSGKTAYVKGEKITGTVPVVSGMVEDIVPANEIGKANNYIYGYAKPAGRTNMQTKMYRAASSINVMLPQKDVATVAGLTSDMLKKDVNILGVVGNYEGIKTNDATAVASDIIKGKTAYVKGEKITGTVDSLSSLNMGAAKNAYVPADDLTSLILNTTITERGILGQNVNYQVKANGAQVTNAIGLSPTILKKGINILGMEGTFDSNPEAYNSKFETAGKTEGLTPLNMLVAVDKINTSAVINAANIFSMCTSLKSLPEMDLNNATSMQNMCYGCQNLLTMPNIAIPNVTNAHQAFVNCNNLSKINLTNTEKLQVATYMFSGCSNISNLPNMSYGNISNKHWMFASTGLNGTVDLSVFTSNNLNTSYIYSNGVFYNCNNITKLSNYNTSTNRALMVSSLASECKNLTTVENFNLINIRYMGTMFSNCTNLKGFNNCYFEFVPSSAYYSENLGYASSAFANCYNLINIPNGIFDNLRIRAGSRMFENCYNLIFPDDLTIYCYNGYSANYEGMFFGCSQIKNINLTFNQIYQPNAPIRSLFANCINLQTANIINARCINSMGGIFNNCSNLKSINFVNCNFRDNVGLGYAFSDTAITSINNISGINYSNPLYIAGAFCNCHNLKDIGNGELNFYRANTANYLFANCENITSISQNQVNLTNVVYCTNMFEGIGVTNFCDWDFPKANYCYGMFTNCTNLKSFSNVTMPLLWQTQYMFKGCNNLETFSNFNFYNAFNCMYMFEDCSNLKTVSNLNCQNIIYMNRMFANCTNLKQISNITLPKMSTMYAGEIFYNCQNISLNNVSLPNATYTWYMFSGAKDIQDLSGLYVPNTTNAFQMFRNTSGIINTTGLNMPKVQNIVNLFTESPNLQEVKNLNFPNAIYAYYMFWNCINLRKIGDINIPNATSFSSSFYNCYNLESIGKITCDKITYGTDSLFTLVNNSTLFNKLNNIGGFINLGKGYTSKSSYNANYTVNLLRMPNLSGTSVQNIVTNLYNLCTTFNTSSPVYNQYVNLYDTQYQNLTDTQINTAKSKGWVFKITNTI